jgi:creatinine amidohydrolase
MHMTRHGAISLKYHTLVEVLTQVAESVYAHGFKKLLLLNGHGGNISAVGAMRMMLAYEYNFPPSVSIEWWRFPSAGY